SEYKNYNNFKKHIQKYIDLLKKLKQYKFNGDDLYDSESLDNVYKKIKSTNKNVEKIIKQLKDSDFLDILFSLWY
ncbi:MAG: hypothetical protein ACP5RI_04070, partial [Candidatus Micrarchaeia archaeon]